MWRFRLTYRCFLPYRWVWDMAVSSDLRIFSSLQMGVGCGLFLGLTDIFYPNDGRGTWYFPRTQVFSPLQMGVGLFVGLTDVFSPYRWVWDVAFSSDSQMLVSGSSDGNARLWNVDSGNIVQEYAGHNKSITCLAFYDGLEPA